ncbi:adenylate/guanylate cyclase domain-containing protein [Allostreptomyces psammosilenae]|uniref:Class 3 adenylate cyclase n=1 Tax=Allostreptomyces psammosilenae TaxID=1892865 RepID=A0A852ZU64_9ACTN|nr:adenylate/guanylate cyclase domain-containing protein [Allostreptomyces psammosilenae]NYI05849.1 class 3 adenylate cyclase [Allostreptomyces psammosilenae]
MTEPVGRTILLMDVEGSGGRDDVEQAVIRRMLYSVLADTLEAAGVEPTERRVEDRGDGVMVLISPTVPKPHLIRALLTETPARLHAGNRVAGPGTQVRLRIVLATGEVALDEHGAVGADLVAAFRLLDSDALRAALRRSAEPSALCVSDAVHHGVVRHGHLGIRPEHFHRFRTPTKEGAADAWLYDPTRTAAGPTRPADGAPAGAEPTPGRPDQPAAPATSATPATPSGWQVGSGNFFFGTASIAGDAVAGDKYMGGGQGGESR